MTARSLTRQTLSIVLAAQLLCALILCGAALLHERHTRFRAFDTRLQGRSDSLLAAIQNIVPETYSSFEPAELKLPINDVYAVYEQDGRLLGISAAAPAALVARGRNEFRDVTVYGNSYRVLQREALRVIDGPKTGGAGLQRSFTVIYASPEAHVWHEIMEAARFYVITIAAVAVAMVFLLAYFLRRALLPLSDLAKAAAGFSTPALDFVAPPSALRILELRPLTDALTESTTRLREAFAREQRFVGDAAHELKTAIAVVHSSVQLLMLKPRSGLEYSLGLNRILEDTQRVEAVVTQMLLLARTVEGADVTPPRLDVALSVDFVVALLEPFAEQRGVQIRSDSSPDLYVRLLPESAETLLSNLIVNAIQHSASSSQIYVSAKSERGSVRLEVVDQGAGISPEALPHIFERFYREDTSRSRETGGTGLGLSICKSIVDRAKGTIEAQSTAGAGTRITVTFRPA